MAVYLKYNYPIHKKTINRYILRLKRKGCKRYSVYDIVVIYKKTRSQGRILERLGFFNPQIKERMFFINTSRLYHWVKKGIFVHWSVKRYFIKMLVL